MRKTVRAMLPLAVLLAGGCAADPRPDATQDAPQPTGTGSQSPVAASPQEERPRVQRLDHLPSGTRPDCRNGRVARAIPGHTGWESRSLREVAAGLLLHPGASRAAISPVVGGRATVVLYRADATTKATFRVSRLDGRWVPDSIAVCMSTVR